VHGDDIVVTVEKFRTAGVLVLALKRYGL